MDRQGLPVGTREPVTAFLVSNPIGALTAAALAAGETFLRLIGLSRPSRAFELSAWSGACGPLGGLPGDPPLPAIPPIDALLIGCGNVMNGWAAARALRITGRARAVDRQSLGGENLGPYSLARRDMIGQPKTLLLARHLEPLITVARQDEELSLFLPRITRWHLPLPPFVINGLDEVEPRHMVQRLWPRGARGHGRRRNDKPGHRPPAGQGGQCLLRAYEAPDSETGYVRRTEAATGLRRERFLSEFTTPVTAEDVAQAPPEHKARLQAAADSGQLICGYINQASLTETSGGDNFAAAAPFIGALTGARAAAVTVAVLAGQHAPGGLRWQYNFLSNRTRTAETRCPATCECQAKSRPSVGTVTICQDVRQLRTLPAHRRSARHHVCSMFARLSRSNPVARGTVRHAAARPARSALAQCGKDASTAREHPTGPPRHRHVAAGRDHPGHHPPNGPADETLPAAGADEFRALTRQRHAHIHA